MSTPALLPQNYYALTGPMTAPGDYAPCFDSLPEDVPALVKTVQGLLLHIFWVERYGCKLTDERMAEVSLRTVPLKMKRLLELDNQPLTRARSLEMRLVGNCRDFTVMLCAMLQHRGVPARARCGFGVYFWPGHYEDHWVCEYWDAGRERWVLVDGQLDDFQQETLKITFDTLDMPRDQFVTGGRAWQMVRRGQANPDDFGIFDMHGIGFIRGNLVRDFLALNKIEILPWDSWGLIEVDDQAAASKDVDLMDEMARLTLAGDEAFPDLRALYERETRLHRMPDWWV